MSSPHPNLEASWSNHIRTTFPTNIYSRLQHLHLVFQDQKYYYQDLLFSWFSLTVNHYLIFIFIFSTSSVSCRSHKDLQSRFIMRNTPYAQNWAQYLGSSYFLSVLKLESSFCGIQFIWYHQLSIKIPSFLFTLQQSLQMIQVSLYSEFWLLTLIWVGQMNGYWINKYQDVKRTW